jgi:hypothetical protein
VTIANANDVTPLPMRIAPGAESSSSGARLPRNMEPIAIHEKKMKAAISVAAIPCVIGTGQITTE